MDLSHYSDVHPNWDVIAGLGRPLSPHPLPFSQRMNT